VCAFWIDWNGDLIVVCYLVPEFVTLVADVHRDRMMQQAITHGAEFGRSPERVAVNKPLLPVTPFHLRRPTGPI
jgi:hypothetical protein